MPNIEVPRPWKEAFTCPHCGIAAKQTWVVPYQVWPAYYDTDACEFVEERDKKVILANANDNFARWGIAECDNCNELSFWHGTSMVYPEETPVDEPNEGMPDDVREIYYEAASVLAKSPRASAALLRLALQMLVNGILGDKAKRNLKDNIEEIGRQEYATPTLIKALDVVRISGNAAVHPGEIDLADDEDPDYLFFLLNMICDAFFTQPKRLEEAYSRIPESRRARLPR